MAYVLKKGVALGAGLVTGNYMDYYAFPATTVTCNASDTIEFAAHCSGEVVHFKARIWHPARTGRTTGFFDQGLTLQRHLAFALRGKVV